MKTRNINTIAKRHAVSAEVLSDMLPEFASVLEVHESLSAHVLRLACVFWAYEDDDKPGEVLPWSKYVAACYEALGVKANDYPSLKVMFSQAGRGLRAGLDPNKAKSLRAYADSAPTSKGGEAKLPKLKDAQAELDSLLGKLKAADKVRVYLAAIREAKRLAK